MNFFKKAYVNQIQYTIIDKVILFEFYKIILACFLKSRKTNLYFLCILFFMCQQACKV